MADGRNQRLHRLHFSEFVPICDHACLMQSVETWIVNASYRGTQTTPGV